MLKIVTVCGSLRAESYNAMVARTLPLLAPEGMQIKASPAIDQIPHYNADVQAKRIPDAATALGEAIRAVAYADENPDVPWCLRCKALVEQMNEAVTAS